MVESKNPVRKQWSDTAPHQSSSWDSQVSEKISVCEHKWGHRALMKLVGLSSLTLHDQNHLHRAAMLCSVTKSLHEVLLGSRSDCNVCLMVHYYLSRFIYTDTEKKVELCHPTFMWLKSLVTPECPGSLSPRSGEQRAACRWLIGSCPRLWVTVMDEFTTLSSLIRSLASFFYSWCQSLLSSCTFAGMITHRRIQMMSNLTGYAPMFRTLFQKICPQCESEQHIFFFALNTLNVRTLIKTPQ